LVAILQLAAPTAALSAATAPCVPLLPALHPDPLDCDRCRCIPATAAAAFLRSLLLYSRVRCCRFQTCSFAAFLCCCSEDQAASSRDRCRCIPATAAAAFLRLLLLYSRDRRCRFQTCSFASFLCCCSEGQAASHCDRCRCIPATAAAAFLRLLLLLLASLASWPLCLPCFMAPVPPLLHGRCAFLASWPLCLPCFVAAVPPLLHGPCASLASWPLCLPCLMAAVPPLLHGRCAFLAPWPLCLPCSMADVPLLLHGACACLAPWPLCPMALPASCPALAVDSAHRTPPSKAQHHLLRSPTSAPRYPTAANTAPHCPSCGVPQWIFLPPHLQPPLSLHPRLSFPACHCLAPHYASCLPRNVPAILLRDCLLDLPCVIFDTLRRHLHHPGLLVKHPQS
jgi:hypothetical protein